MVLYWFFNNYVKLLTLIVNEGYGFFPPVATLPTIQFALLLIWVSRDHTSVVIVLMAKYLRNDSQTENLVEEELPSELSEPEPVSICITDSKNIHVGVETIHNENVILQEVYPKSCDSKIDLLNVKNLFINSQDQLEKVAKNVDSFNSNQNDSNNRLWMKKVLPVVIILAIIPVIIGSLFVLFIVNAQSNLMPNGDAEYPEDYGLCFVHRTEWVARSPAEIIRGQILPVKRVIIAHTASEPCYTRETCRPSVQIIQRFHIDSKKFSDIGYNFLIGGDGCVYIGRGWNYVGAHTKRYNLKSVGIALIGTFNIFPPTELQVNATAKLINLGIKLGKISKSYVLNGMCQLTFTQSPGKVVYDIISKWNHFIISNVTPLCYFGENIMSTSTENSTDKIQSYSPINITGTAMTTVSSPDRIIEFTNSTILGEDSSTVLSTISTDVLSNATIFRQNNTTNTVATTILHPIIIADSIRT